MRSGLETAAWVTVDDTGARHKAVNGFCTQIGNDRFAWFGTTGSKSRLNFLELLRAGHGDYLIDAEALAGSEPSMPRPISPPSNTWPIICCAAIPPGFP